LGLSILVKDPSAEDGLRRANTTYSGFNQFTNALIDAMSAELRAKGEMDEDDGLLHRGEETFDGWCARCGQPTLEPLDEQQVDPLTFLVYHSDCDGMLTPWQAGLIKGRLLELGPRLRAGWMREYARDLAEICRVADETNQIVVWS
jgi:hypothetical protein